MLSVLYIMISLALLTGIILGYSWLQSRVGSASLVKRIDAILPQTQCGQCSYAGCKPYATAIAQGDADINQCPPGGEAGVRALASLLDMPYKPLNIEYGVTKPKSRALIDENICIGCTICIQACPVDAILGASKHMHTVITAECTGCELCVAPCPVDCISMEAIAQLPEKSVAVAKFSLFQSWRYAKSKIMPTGATRAADIARERYEFRLMRLARDKQERAQRRAQKTASTIAGSEAVTGPQEKAEENKKAAIAAAIERVKAQQTILTSHHRSKPPAPLS